MSTFSERLDEAIKSEILPKKLIKKFNQRTQKHIDRVVRNAEKLNKKFPDKFKGLVEQAKKHDASKFKEPEFTPYVWLTEFYDCKKRGVSFEYPDGMKDRVDGVTLRHITSNRHHAEFHDPSKDEMELGNNRSLEETCDSSSMPEVDLAEMVCDWAAMSQELGDSLTGWADKNIGKRWKFSDKQVDLIYELIDVLEGGKTLDEALWPFKPTPTEEYPSSEVPDPIEPCIEFSDSFFEELSLYPHDEPDLPDDADDDL